MFMISILRWLGFLFGSKTVEPAQVKFIPVEEALVKVEAIMDEEDAGTTHPEALSDVEPEVIFDLGKPITCLMLTCKGCDKVDPIEGCIAYEDPALLIWHKQGHFCPHNAPVVIVSKKKTNPLKASKREARALKATKAA